jgi:hypothetical protein
LQHPNRDLPGESRMVVIGSPTLSPPFKQFFNAQSRFSSLF